ncbi:hypothetical protein BKA70DRAFT_1126192 [Coprinopsis sp. MPI-PUGE-AT-0042]|nr:hypothetical protein BKA70DRAFT_1126192 [Coprinopsis sp. MPI-PUGE-AT-0042]
MNTLGGGFRIFVPTRVPAPRRPLELGKPPHKEREARNLDIYIVSKRSWQANGQPEATYGRVVAGNHTLDKRAKLIPTQTQTAEVGLLTAILDTLQVVEDAVRLRFHLESKPLIENLTRKLVDLEDKAWTTHRHGQMVAAVVSRLRRRDGFTTFSLVKSESPHELTRRAAKLAEEARADAAATDQEIRPLAPSMVHGARLEVLSQADLYRLIQHQRRKSFVPRRQTSKNMADTRKEIAERIGKAPDPDAVWLSLKTGLVRSRKTKALLWKIMHDALPVGEMWNRGGGDHEKAKCPECATVESQEHLFTRCRGNGQRVIWDCTRELLLKKGIDFPRDISISTILGSAITEFRTDDAHDAGKSDLYTKIMVESTYLVWLLRCKWKVGDGGARSKVITPTEARNKWRVAVNSLLVTDIISTNEKRYGTKASAKEQIVRTWEGVVEDNDKLREAVEASWGTGVVVGIG